MAKGDKEQYALGIDLGGTKILAGVIELNSGKVIATAKKRTKADQGMKELLDRLGDTAEDALKEAKLKAGSVQTIGVAAAGQVDPKTGSIVTAPNLGGLGHIPIGETLQKRLGLPVRLGNDVQGAALGELRFGAARDAERALCVFIGTGIGGALITNGEIDSGPDATAGEIGHTIVHADGRYCGCGGRGHLEAYASRTAITKRLQEELRRGRSSILNKLLKEDTDDEREFAGTAIRSGILAKAFAENDDLTVEVLHEAARFLGYGLASVVNFYNPRRIILGGGVIEAIPNLIKLIDPIIKRESLPVSAAGVDIVASALGDNAGIVGAAIMGHNAQAS